MTTRDAIVAAVRLARLELSGEALDRLATQVAGILGHVEELSAVPLEGAEPIGGSADWAAPRRADEPAPDPLHGPLAELAPAWHDGFFTVPRLASMEAPADDPS